MNNDMALVFLYFGAGIYYIAIAMSSPNAKIYENGKEIKNKSDKKRLHILLVWMAITFQVAGIYFAEGWYRIFGIIIMIILHAALFRSLKSKGN